jgi:HD-GYP domain-containing protein (c-di-GMP phosphodiesterase class II)
MMRRHPLLSVRIMERMEFLEQEIPAVRYHHERYDGTGYPEGIAGAAIPLTARILAVADAFEAMTSSRPFRRAKTLAEAVEEVRHGSGTQFDPAVVEAFLGVAVRLGDKMLEVPGIASASSAELFAAR